MNHLRVSLFGKFEVSYSNGLIEDLNGKKVQELLCYLFLNRERPHSREKLASLLWSENCTTSQSKAYLRKTLWQLQSALSAHEELVDYELVIVGPHWVELNTSDIWLDVDVFERTYETVKGIPGTELADQNVRMLQEAIELRKGDLLENWYQDWCLFERERIQNIYLFMLDKMMEYCESCGRCEMGVGYGNLSLCIDPARERTHRHLMRLHTFAGDRIRALRQYQQCEVTLRDELGIEPSEPTRQLYSRIRDDKIRPVIREDRMPTLNQNDDRSSIQGRLDRIKKLQQIQVHIQNQIQNDIKAIETALLRRETM